MIPVSEIRNGMVLRAEEHLMKVLSFEMHGAAKASRVVHAKLRLIATGVVVDRRFRADEKVDDVPLESTRMEYLYKDGTNYVFMNLTTYEEVTIAEEIIGPPAKYLKPNTEITVEYCDGKPANTVLPRLAEVRVATTAPGISGQADSTFKEAVLENGLQIMVPQFIREGDTVKVEVETGRYVDRVVSK